MRSGRRAAYRFGAVVALTVGLLVAMFSVPSGPVDRSSLGGSVRLQLSAGPDRPASLAWIQVLGAGPQAARAYEQLAYDPADNSTVMVGGAPVSAGIEFNITLTYAGGVWGTDTPPPGAPTPAGTVGETGGAITYDSTIGAVLFVQGVLNGTTGLEQTWTFLNGNWTQLNLSSEPSPRQGSALAYDPALNETVLYGGANIPDCSDAGCPGDNDTWVFSNDSWSPLPGAVGTGTMVPYFLPSMAYDATSDQLILVAYGGTVSESGFLVDYNTYAFNGSGWTPLGNLSSDGAITGLAYDPLVGGLVALGDDYWSNQTTETWFFSNGTWQAEYLPGSVVGQSTLAYDAADGYLMTVGHSENFDSYVGYTPPDELWTSQTWELTPAAVGGLPGGNISLSSTRIGLGQSLTISMAGLHGFGVLQDALSIPIPGCPNATFGPSVTCVPSAPGNYTVMLFVEDQAGRTATMSAKVTVLAWPAGQVVIPSVVIGVVAAAAYWGLTRDRRVVRPILRQSSTPGDGHPPSGPT